MADADGWARVTDQPVLRQPRRRSPAVLAPFPPQPIIPAFAVYTVDTSAEMEIFRNVLTQDLAEPPLFEVPKFSVVGDLADLVIWRFVQTDDGGYPPQGNVPTVFVANAWVLAWDGPGTRRRPIINVTVPQFYVAAWQGNVPTVFVAHAWVVMWDGPPRAPFPAWAQQDFTMRWERYVRIVSAPTLRGVKANPTLLGEV